MQNCSLARSEERGALPLTPAQGPFEKRPLRIPKTFKNIMMGQGKLIPVAVLVSPMGPLPHSDIWGTGMV